MSAPVKPTNDRVEAAVAAKLEAKAGGAMPDDWNVYVRRDLNFLAGDQYPLVYIVGLPSVILEEETDNRQLVGYPLVIVLEVNEATVDRTESDLVSLRRKAQGALYTTRYTELVAAGLPVEDVRLSEEPGIPLPTVDDGITATGFSVTIGVIEPRCPAEEVTT